MLCRIINVEADNSYRDIDNSAYHKTESNNCFIIHFKRKKISIRERDFEHKKHCLQRLKRLLAFHSI